MFVKTKELFYETRFSIVFVLVIYCVVVESLSCVSLFCDPMDCVARHSPLSMGFPRQEYWSRLPFSSPGDLPDPGTESASPALAGEFFTTVPPIYYSPIYPQFSIC